MSRDTEKLLKELQSFLMQHGDEAADEDSMDRLAEQFLSEQGIHPVDENAAPKTADDYLDLAEQATSRKKCIEYLHKALELEPDNVDAQLQLIVHTMEHKVDAAAPGIAKAHGNRCKAAGARRGISKRTLARSGRFSRPDRICASVIAILTP